jgi:hypothetical protein
MSKTTRASYQRPDRLYILLVLNLQQILFTIIFKEVKNFELTDFFRNFNNLSEN